MIQQLFQIGFFSVRQLHVCSNSEVITVIVVTLVSFLIFLHLSKLDFFTYVNDTSHIMALPSSHQQFYISFKACFLA